MSSPVARLAAISSSFSVSDPSQTRMRSGRVMAAISSTHARIPGCANAPCSVISLSYRLEPRLRDGEIRRHELMTGGLPLHLDVGALLLQHPREPFGFVRRDDGIEAAV